MSERFSRRHFLATSTAWAAGRGVGSGAETPDRKMVSIIHTTDLHGHLLPTTGYSGRAEIGGFARCATKIRQWRKENPDSLLVDIGDLYQGTAVSFQNEGRLFVDLLDRFGYDAWCLGNHEFDWGPEILSERLRTTKTPVLSGNLTGAAENVIPWKMCEISGFKIALIGLVTPGLPYWLMPETLGGISPTDPSVSLRKSIAAAKAAKADAIVVLGHFGHRKVDDFANPLRETIRAAPGADVFIGGHTHVHVPALKIDDTLFTQAGCFGIHCGRVDLVFDANTRKLVTKSADTEFMGGNYEPDPGVLNFSKPELKSSEEQLARRIANLEKPISGKGDESELAIFICQALAAALARNGTPVDAVFHGTFASGGLPAGPVTVADAWKILPYENTLVTAALTPAQLMEILAEDRQTHSDRTLWPFDVVWEKRKPVRILKDGSELPVGKTVTVAFNSYDSQSAGRTLMRLREIIHLPSSKRNPVPVETRGALIEHFLNS